MAADHADSSQVGLFSAQISEQIARLRALESTGGASNPETNLRRAIMATRLLAGSSRILAFGELQDFLDLLLRWLQALESGPRELNTTQTLLLESVIDLEETLMRQFDAGGSDAGDLSAHLEAITDLQTLIERNLEELERQSGEPEATETPERTETPATRETAATPETTATPPTPPAREPVADEDGTHADESRAEAAADALEDAVRRLQEVLDHTTSPAALEILRGELGDRVRQLQAIDEQLEMRSRAQRAPSRPSDPDLGPALRRPEEDPVYAPVVERLQAAADRAEARLVFRAHGSARGADEAIQALARDLFEALGGDVADELAAQSVGRPVHVTASLRAEQGHLVGLLGDDLGEAATRRGPLDIDHLAVLPGLRRARSLLTHHDGLLRAHPAGESLRYRFTLPLSTDHPRYAVLHRGDEAVALSASLVEDVLHAPPMETDPDGQRTLMLEGRAVPVVDLAELSAAATYQPDPGEHVAVFGFVEKRLAMPCDGSIELHSSSELLDPPPEWEGLAQGALAIEGETVVVLDVRALLGRRFRPAGPEVSTPAEEPPLDSFVPVRESPRVRSRARRAVIVNQSEFRRRELSRTLQGQGMSVQAVADLAEAEELLSAGDTDLLLSDLRLGRGQPSSFHRLREERPDLRVVLTTAVAEAAARELAEKAGADACWREPFRGSDFRRILAGLED